MFWTERSLVVDKCLIASSNDADLCPKKLVHVNFDTMNKLVRENLVRGLPKGTYKRENVCKPCELAKIQKSSFKDNNVASTKRPLELLHLDLFDPSKHGSLNDC